MNPDLLRDLASWICLLAGGGFCLVGGIGLLRMPDFYTRMHAASVTDTIGAGLVLLGLLFQAGFSLVGAKLVMVGLLIFFTSPTASHALARSALLHGLKPRLADDGPTPQARTVPGSPLKGKKTRGAARRVSSEST